MILCVDSIDQEDVQTVRVFEEVVRVTHDLSPMCTFFEFFTRGLNHLNPFSRGDSGIIG